MNGIKARNARRASIAVFFFQECRATKYIVNEERHTRLSHGTFSESTDNTVNDKYQVILETHAVSPSSSSSFHEKEGSPLTQEKFLHDERESSPC
jgi:hypothetical protein